MKKKTSIILMCSIIPALLAASLILINVLNNDTTASTSEAEWTDHYNDVNGLIEGSDIVIKGKVVDSSTEQRVDMIFTKQEIEVSHVYAGSIKKGSIIEVLQTGGEMNNIKTEPFEEAPLLTHDGSYLLFLKYSDEGHYLILGGYQGVGEFKNNKIIFDKSNSKIAKDFKNKNMTDVEKFLFSKGLVVED